MAPRSHARRMPLVIDRKKIRLYNDPLRNVEWTQMNRISGEQWMVFKSKILCVLLLSRVLER